MLKTHFESTEVDRRNHLYVPLGKSSEEKKEEDPVASDEV